MADLKNPKWMYLKALLLLACGLLAGIIVWAEAPSLRNAILLGVCVWGFSRAYYFAFYVIQHYIDPQFRFAGLIDVARYLLGRPRQ